MLEGRWAVLESAMKMTCRENVKGAQGTGDLELGRTFGDLTGMI